MEVTVSALKKVMGAKEVFKEFGIYIYMFNNIYIYTRWWFQIFLFLSLPGEMIEFD